MRRVMLLLATPFLCCFIASAQPQPYEIKTDYQKTQLAAAAMDLSYSTDIVEGAVKDYMASKGLQGSSQKGFTVYRNARLGDTASALKDLYVKIEKRNQDKNESTIILFAIDPSADPAARSSDAGMPLDPAKAFLNTLEPRIEAQGLEAQIGAQEELTKKSRKKYSNLQDDQSDLEKKISNAKSDLEQNKRNQGEQSALVQANVNGDQDAMKKAQKKMNNLISEQSSLEKKINKYTSELARNKNDQTTQKADITHQQQALDSMKASRKIP